MQANPASVNCSDPDLDCLSYLFVGGLESISPYYATWQNIPPEADTILVHQESGLQVDYWNMSTLEEDFPVSACQTWFTFAGNYAFQICLKESNLDGITLIAGTVPFYNC
jgi:hypothetical protein